MRNNKNCGVHKMENMIKFLLPLVIVLLGCSKAEGIEDVPSCISKEIEKFRLDNSCDKSKVDEYLFQNKKVYVFDDQLCCCDYTAEVRDEECQSLGFLGGFVGNQVINGENFSSALLLRHLWKE